MFIFGVDAGVIVVFLSSIHFAYFRAGNSAKSHLPERSSVKSSVASSQLYVYVCAYVYIYIYSALCYFFFFFAAHYSAKNSSESHLPE